MNQQGAEGDEDQAQGRSLDGHHGIYNEHEGQNNFTTGSNDMGPSPSYSQASWNNDKKGAGGPGVERGSVGSHLMSMTPDKRYRKVDSTTAEGGEAFQDKDSAGDIASTRSSGRFACGTNDLDDRAEVSAASQSRGWSNPSREGNNRRGHTQRGSSGCPDLFIERSHQSSYRISDEAMPARGKAYRALYFYKQLFYCRVVFRES